jgi:hypothetical protein
MPHPTPCLSPRPPEEAICRRCRGPLRCSPIATASAPLVTCLPRRLLQSHAPRVQCTAKTCHARGPLRNLRTHLRGPAARPTERRAVADGSAARELEEVARKVVQRRHAICRAVASRAPGLDVTRAAPGSGGAARQGTVEGSSRGRRPWSGQVSHTGGQDTHAGLLLRRSAGRAAINTLIRTETRRSVTPGDGRRAHRRPAHHAVAPYRP